MFERLFKKNITDETNLCDEEFVNALDNQLVGCNAQTVVWFIAKYFKCANISVREFVGITEDRLQNIGLGHEQINAFRKVFDNNNIQYIF